MNIREHEPLKSKTTMRIGGRARYYADLESKGDAEQAYAFAKEKGIPLIVLGSGSNTIFADGEIDALIVRIKADEVHTEGNRVTIEAGKILPVLINELAEQDLDLSALTGIPGTVGGVVFGNAGQGPKGIWIDSFIESVTALIYGKWQTLSKEECNFRYRESGFKDRANKQLPPIIWEATLNVPSRPSEETKEEIERLLQRRIETQPHIKTAGSCFKALPDGTPAWQLIDKSGLRGLKIGGIEVSEKHANFLLNVREGTFEDLVAVTRKIQEQVPDIAGIEMRLYKENGNLAA